MSVLVYSVAHRRTQVPGGSKAFGKMLNIVNLIKVYEQMRCISMCTNAQVNLRMDLHAPRH